MPPAVDGVVGSRGGTGDVPGTPGVPGTPDDPAGSLDDCAWAGTCCKVNRVAARPSAMKVRTNIVLLNPVSIDFGGIDNVPVGFQFLQG